MSDGKMKEIYCKVCNKGLKQDDFLEHLATTHKETYAKLSKLNEEHARISGEEREVIREILGTREV